LRLRVPATGSPVRAPVVAPASPATRVRDFAEYRKFLGEVLVNIPGVRETRTYAVLEEVKSTGVLPV